MTDEKKFRFTEARLRQLPAPTAGRTHYYDQDVPDLELRVTPRGTKSFYAYLWSTALNRPVRVYLGKWPAVAVEDARKLAQKQIAEVVYGKDPTSKKRATREELTLGNAVAMYFDSLRLNERKPLTFRLYRSLDARFLNDWHTKRLGSISTDTVLAIRMRARDQDGSRAVKREKTRREKSNRTVTANRVIRLLSQVFNNAIRSGWPGRNPCDLIKPFPEKPTTRRLEENEIGPFIKACETTAQDKDQIGDYLLVCLFSGIRRRNVASAKWADINLEHGTWDVPETKNGLPLRVYISRELKAVFERRYKSRSFSQFVFPAESRSGHLDEPRKGLIRVLKASKINPQGLTVHALKHSFISYAYSCGLNPILVSRLGGHKIATITARYGHASDQQVREAYGQVTAAMMRDCNNESQKIQA